jgi:hypothetical protein
LAGGGKYRRYLEAVAEELGGGVYAADLQFYLLDTFAEFLEEAGYGAVAGGVAAGQNV